MKVSRKHVISWWVKYLLFEVINQVIGRWKLINNNGSIKMHQSKSKISSNRKGYYLNEMKWLCGISKTRMNHMNSKLLIENKSVKVSNTYYVEVIGKMFDISS